MQRHFCLIQALQEYTLNIDLAQKRDAPNSEIEQLRQASKEADFEF